MIADRLKNTLIADQRLKWNHGNAFDQKIILSP